MAIWRIGWMKGTVGREIRGYCSNKGGKWICPEPRQWQWEGEGENRFENSLERIHRSEWLDMGMKEREKAKMTLLLP